MLLVFQSARVLLACGDKIASGEDHTGDTDSDAETDTRQLFNFYTVVEP